MQVALDREVLPARRRLRGPRVFAVAVIVALLASVSALVADRRATGLDRQRAIAEARTTAARARLHEVRLRLETLVVRPIPELPLTPHPSDADIAEHQKRLDELRRERDRLRHKARRLGCFHLAEACHDHALCDE